MQLIIINGPSGVGKSTVARMLHQEMPHSFLLEQDAQRRFMSHYREFPDESRALAYAVGHSIVRTCLERGHDVIVDRQMLAAEHLDAFTALGKEHGATVREFILWAPKESCLMRAGERQENWTKGGLLTKEKCELFWEKMNVFKDQRPEATRIDVTGLSPEEVLTAVRSALRD